MRLWQFIRGHPVIFQSGVSQPELERRVSRAALSEWDTWARGVIGQARSGHIRLRYRSGPFETSEGGVLTGDIVEAHDATRLLLRYRPTVKIYFFLLTWYFFTLLFFGGVVVGGALGRYSATGQAAALVIMSVFLLAPIGIAYREMRTAKANFGKLVSFLDDVAEARPIDGAAAGV